jgi:hypothetical protein
MDANNKKKKIKELFEEAGNTQYVYIEELDGNDNPVFHTRIIDIKISNGHLMVQNIHGGWMEVFSNHKFYKN